jgi:hypothetical protein
VTGTYAYAAGLMADAECSQWPRDGQWHVAAPWERSPHGGGLDLTVNGRAPSWTPMVDDGTGCDATTHTYTGIVTSRGHGPLRLAVRTGSHDSRSDRDLAAGSLHVVLRPLDGTARDD